MTIQWTLLQCAFLPCPVCMTITVSCFSALALPVVPTVKSTFQPVVSKNRKCKTWRLPLDIVWEFKELNISPCWCFKCFSCLNGNNCLWLPGLKLIKIMKFIDAFLLWHLNGNESISWDSSGDHCKITVWMMPVAAEVKKGLVEMC